MNQEEAITLFKGANQKYNSLLKSLRKNFEEKKLITPCLSFIDQEVENYIDDYDLVFKKRIKKINKSKHMLQYGFDRENEGGGFFLDTYGAITGDYREWDYISDTLALTNPKLIINEIQHFQDEVQSDIYQRYLQFTGSVRNEHFYGKLVQRITLPEDSIKNLVKLSTEPLNQLKPDISKLGDAYNYHIKHLEKLKEDSRGKGLAKYLGIAGGILASLGVGAVTFNPFVSRAARKSTSKKISKWLIRNKHWSGIKDSNKACISAYSSLVSSSDRVKENLKINLSYLLLNMYGGFIDKLDSDLNSVNREVEHINWEKNEIIFSTNKTGKGDIEKWIKETEEKIVQKIEENYLASAGDIAEKALLYVLNDSVKANYIPAYPNSTKRKKYISSCGNLSASVLFAKYRYYALAEVAGQNWSNGEYFKAGTLYLNAFYNFKIIWNDKNDSKKIGEAIIRIALVGFSEKAPEYLKDNKLQGLELYLQYKYRKKHLPESLLATEGISEETIDAVNLLSNYVQDNNLENKIKTDISPELNFKLSDIEYPLKKGRKYHEIDKKYGFHDSSDINSSFSNWIKEKRRKKIIIYFSIIIISMLVIHYVLF